MSNLQRLENSKQLVMQLGPNFKKLACIHGAVQFEREASFAIQALQNNNYLASIAFSNPDSLKMAVINIAAIGLSLSPIYRYGYLVPRDKKVCLDISYRGFIHLACEVGSIKWALAEIVCGKDSYEYQGMGYEPIHKFNPFIERGEIIGAYCVAKTYDGEFITTHMTIKEIYSIRDRSSAWKAYVRDKQKLGPWVTDNTEMIKKTVIKRAYKSWPMTDKTKRLDKAFDITNSNDPINFSNQFNNDEPERKKGIENIKKLLIKLDRTEDKFIEHLIRILQRDIKALNELTLIEINEATTMLTQFVNQSTNNN